MKFSIITPTYNRAHTLQRAIDSLLQQSYQNFEMIIVDDGSTDETTQVVKRYLSDPRIKYITSNKNAGVGVARNIGLDSIASDVQWVTFLDSDDEFVSDALENMHKTITRNRSIHYFRFAAQYTSGEYACDSRQDGAILDYQAVLSTMATTGEWVSLLSREIIDNGFRFEESVNGFEHIAWFQLSKREKVLYDATVVRRYHTDTISFSNPGKIDRANYCNRKRGIELSLRILGKDLQKYAIKMYTRELYALGNINFILGNYKLGLKNTFEAFKQDPFNPRLVRNFFTLLFSKKIKK